MYSRNIKLKQSVRESTWNNKDKLSMSIRVSLNDIIIATTINKIDGHQGKKAI